MEILVVIATYNERDNIQSLVKKVLELRDDIRVLVIDDASPDGTGDVADRLARETGRVEVIHRRGKLGLGTALITGLKRGIELNSDLVATMDADHSHAPEYLPEMIERSRDSPLVVGSRYVPGGGVENWGLKRICLSRLANFYARTVTGVPTKDCTTGYRVYRSDFLADADLDTVASRGYSFLVEILMMAHRGGHNVAEVPIIFTDRIKGQSKINMKEIVGGAWSLFKRRIRGDGY